MPLFNVEKTFILLLSSIIPVSVLAQQEINPYSYSVRKKVECTKGAVVSAHPLASQVGVSILKQGGNAIDAAIATQLALAVVYPAAGNIGGGGFLVATLANGKTVALDFREKAPLLASRNMYLDSNGNAQMDVSQSGHLSSGVPGSVAGIFTAFKYAKLPFKKLIQPAIELADKGFALTEAEARSLNGTQDDFLKFNSILPVFIRKDGWKAGDTLVQKDLARTLMRIRDLGMSDFYTGETARLIIEEMKRRNGIITYEDLRTYTAKERTPVIFDYKSYRIVTMPLPSSGGVLLPQMMRMIEDQTMKNLGFQTAKALHLMTEVERLAYADRAKYLGDNDFFKVPVKTLTSYPYIMDRMNLFDPNRAGNSKNIQGGNLSLESEETTHFDVYDKEGNAVSVTTTLNGGFGSRTVVGGAGFFMNNEMDDFSIKPGTPNMYGAIGGDANAIAPGKRMLSSMTPTIVLKNDRPMLVLGTPGGTTITTSVFQTLVNILEFNMSTEDAVNQPKFHHQWLPDVIFVEHEFPMAVRTELEKMGYKIQEREPIGRTEVIRIYPDSKIEAVGDKRGDDSAEGY